MAGSITLDWGDGTYTFRLEIGDFRELQDNPNINVGPLALFRRIENDTWRADDIPEVIRLALIRGSKLPSVKAMKLVQRYYHEANKFGGKELAMKILGIYLIWPEDDPVGKPEAKANGQTTQTVSPSPTSTPQAGN